MNESLGMPFGWVGRERLDTRLMTTRKSNWFVAHELKLTLRKQPTFREVATWVLAKRRLSNERRNSILMTRHYPDLGRASDWLKRNSLAFQPIRSTASIWVVTRHQYGICALVTQTSICEGSSGNLAKRRLFSQANSNWHLRSFLPDNLINIGLTMIAFSKQLVQIIVCTVNDL